jgi:hypothetical protein
VATVPRPATYEKLAANELVNYFEQMTSKKLALIQVADKKVPPGTIAVGTLATEAGLITAEELAPLVRDGYIIRVADGRAAVCGYRDVATAYAVYGWLERLGIRFPASRSTSIYA